MTRPTSESGTTLVEMVLFGAVASVVMVGMIGLLSRAGTFLELGQRTSGSQGDLKILMESLSEDSAELLYLEGSGGVYDSNAAGSALTFVIRSSRVEAGLPTANTPSLRRVEYRIEGGGTVRDCVRTVTPLTAPGKTAGPPASHRLVQSGIVRLQAWPVAAIPKGDSYRLVMATDPAARAPGATVACLVVDVSTGARAPGKTAMDAQPVTALVAKLWCRNRVMELARGALR
jgi:hypothetical protein